jgi:cytochrome oxidase assembly protein ShyY1
MAICNTVVVAVDFKHQDHSRLIRVLRAVEQFPFRMPDLFPVQQKDGQVAATLMADIGKPSHNKNISMHNMHAQYLLLWISLKIDLTSER